MHSRRIAVGLAVVAVIAAVPTVAAAFRGGRVVPAVKVLATKSAPQTAATGAGAKAPLLSAGGITQQAVCLDTGGGTVELDIRIKSTVSAAVLTGIGGVGVGGQFQILFTVASTDTSGFEENYGVMLADGSVQRFRVDFGVHVGTMDCRTQITRYSA